MELTANNSQIGHLAMADNWKTKGLEIHHQGKFLHNYYTFEPVYDSNHDSVVKTFILGLSCELWGFINSLHYITLHYVAQFSLYQECNSLELEVALTWDLAILSSTIDSSLTKVCCLYQ